MYQIHYRFVREIVNDMGINKIRRRISDLTADERRTIVTMNRYKFKYADICRKFGISYWQAREIVLRHNSVRVL